MLCCDYSMAFIRLRKTTRKGGKMGYEKEKLWTNFLIRIQNPSCTVNRFEEHSKAFGSNFAEDIIFCLYIYLHIYIYRDILVF
jgi:hypothetical protein